MCRAISLLATLLAISASLLGQDLLESPEGLATLTVPASSGYNFTPDLVAYWKLNEASGDAVDSQSTNTLTDTGTVTASTGVVGGARFFTRASSQYFTKNDTTALSITNSESFTLACWFRVYATNLNLAMVGQWDSGVSFSHFISYTHNEANHLTFRIRGTTLNTVTVNAGDIVTNQWYCVIAWHDTDANTISISVYGGAYDGTPANTAFNDTVVDGTNPFQIGRGVYNGSSYFMAGEIDNVAFAKRVWTSGERARFYNAGTGRDIITDP